MPCDHGWRVNTVTIKKYKSIEVEEISDDKDNQIGMENHIEMEDNGDTEENIENNQSTAKEQVQTANEEFEHNPNETLPEGWKRAG